MNAPTTDDETPSGLSRAIIACLFVVGVGLVIIGCWRYWESRQVSDVVDRFVIAMRDGDRETAIPLLPENLQASVSSWTANEEREFWQPLPDFSYRFHHVTFIANTEELTGAKKRKECLKKKKPIPSWVVDPELTQKRLDDGMNVAEVQIWIERGGFLIKPYFLLESDGSKDWQIFEIQNFVIDPRWDDEQFYKSQSEAAELSEELQNALKNQPGVTVERSPLN